MQRFVARISRAFDSYILLTVIHDKFASVEIVTYLTHLADMRKSGILIQLDANGFSELKEIINRVEQTIEKLQSSKQMRNGAKKILIVIVSLFFLNKIMALIACPDCNKEDYKYSSANFYEVE